MINNSNNSIPGRYIQRNAEEKLRQYLDAPEILVVIGPRRAGKTTLVRHVVGKEKGFCEVSFNDQEARLLFEKKPAEFAERYVRPNRYLFIDEFQYARNGGRILKYLVDDPQRTTKIIISGSSADDLTIRAVRYLAGRIIRIDVLPLSFGEILRGTDPMAHGHALAISGSIAGAQSRHEPIRIDPEIHKKLASRYEEYLRFGGYPRVVLEPDIEQKKVLLKNLVSDLMLREVRDLLGLIEDDKLYALIKGLAAQIGGLIGYDDLRNVSGYAHPTLKKYLNFLQKTYIINLVRPYYKNRRTEVVKSPKVYFTDTGLRNSILDDFRPLNERPDAGALLENGIAMGSFKALAASPLTLHFWRDKNQHEVDFVLEQGSGVFLAIEAKMQPPREETDSMRAFRRAYPAIPLRTAFVDLPATLPADAVPVYSWFLP